MKSLEIVNSRLNDTFGEKEKLYSAVVLGNETIINTDELETIKADLEVLEIIRKKKVDLAHLEFCITIYKNNEKLLEVFNTCYCPYKNELTMEELLKLKQWLEENEK